MTAAHNDTEVKWREPPRTRRSMFWLCRLLHRRRHVNIERHGWYCRECDF